MSSADVADIRPGYAFDLIAPAHLPTILKACRHCRSATWRHSNRPYLSERVKYVYLRKKPSGQLLPSAQYDRARYRVIAPARLQCAGISHDCCARRPSASRHHFLLMRLRRRPHIARSGFARTRAGGTARHLCGDGRRDGPSSGRRLGQPGSMVFGKPPVICMRQIAAVDAAIGSSKTHAIPAMATNRSGGLRIFCGRRQDDDSRTATPS